MKKETEMTKPLHRCIDCEKTFKTSRAFEAHSCPAKDAYAKMSLDELMALYEARKAKPA